MTSRSLTVLIQNVLNIVDRWPERLPRLAELELGE